MAEKVSAKSNAAEILDKQLYNRAKKGQYGFIVMSSATDPYLQFEKETQLTRSILQVILKHKFPLHIITKSDLILRDIDLLTEIHKKSKIPHRFMGQLQSGLIVSFSFTTVDDKISKLFESAATPPSVRLATAQTLVQHEFKVGISMMPLLPYLTDTTQSLNEMFAAFKQIGVQYILPATITLFGNENHDSRQLVFRAIKKHYPDLLPKYEKLLGQHDYLPSYYNLAFQRKMDEMSREFEIPLRIAM